MSEEATKVLPRYIVTHGKSKKCDCCGGDSPTEDTLTAFTGLIQNWTLCYRCYHGGLLWAAKQAHNERLGEEAKQRFAAAYREEIMKGSA